jgi:hypothetical protein
MGLVAQAAIKRGISRLLIAVHPRHVPFYSRIAGFRAFTPELPHPCVNGLPAVGMQLNLTTIHVDHPEIYRRYLDMAFAPIALSTGLASPNYLQRIAALWQGLHVEPSEFEWEASAETEEIAA